MEIFLEYLDSLPDYLVYVLLGLSAFVENIFPPIPGDTIIVFGAFLVGIGRLDLFWVYFSTTLGSLSGFMSLFWIGRYLGRRFFIERDYRFIKAKNIIRAEDWFRKYGYFLIVLNRFIPAIRSVISVAVGISGLSGTKVSILALTSCAVWNIIWTLLGYALGSNWEAFKTSMSAIMMRYNITILFFFCVFILFIIIRRQYKRKK
jgi:membrane protein DedA with SNARE-associated domain